MIKYFLLRWFSALMFLLDGLIAFLSLGTTWSNFYIGALTSQMKYKQKLEYDNCRKYQELG